MVLDEAGRPPHSTLPAAEPLLENGFCSNAQLAVAALKKMKIETVLFSSSLEPIVRPIGEKLGVEQVEAELFPEDKCCKLAALQRRAKKVALLSDDVKAGSALFHADVAVVVGAPTGVEGSVGDAFFLSKNLNDFADVLAIARRAQRIITANLVAAVLASSVGIGLAMGGRLSPTWALAVRFASELVLVLNAARLLPFVPTIAGRRWDKAERYACE